MFVCVDGLGSTNVINRKINKRAGAEGSSYITWIGQYR